MATGPRRRLQPACLVSCQACKKGPVCLMAIQNGCTWLLLPAERGKPCLSSV